MLAIGSWIAGHQTPRDNDGVSGYAVPLTINGILALYRDAVAGGTHRNILVKGVMPSAYVAGSDMSLCMCWAIGATTGPNWEVAGHWRRYPSGSVASAFLGPVGSGAFTAAPAAYTVQYGTVTLSGSGIGCLADEHFDLQMGLSLDSADAYILSLQLWVP